MIRFAGLLPQPLSLDMVTCLLMSSLGIHLSTCFLIDFVVGLLPFPSCLFSVVPESAEAGAEECEEGAVQGA